MDKIKNVLILCHYAQQPPYNTMLRYHNWGKELVNRGYSVTIVSASTVHNTDIDVIEKLNSDNDICCGINYLYLPTTRYTGNGLGRMKNMLQFGLSLKKMKNSNNNPDVIIVCEAYLYLFAKHYFRNIPIITDIVDLWPLSIIEYSGKSKFNPLIQMLYWVEKQAYINTDALIFSMEGGKDYVLEQSYSYKVSSEKIFHINMGIDIEETDRNRKNKLVDLTWDMKKLNIVYIGSIRKANNVKQICDAAIELKKRNQDDVVFQIYGNGDELEELQKYSNDNNLDNINFYGRIKKEEIPYILAHATANILTYKQVGLMKYGGSQSKLFDYLASGKPIICNAIFGYNLITRYDCGIVTKNQSSSAFADSVFELCNKDNSELEQMGANARKTAELYDIPLLVDQLCKVFEYLEQR